MNGLGGDDALEQRSGTLPADALEAESPSSSHQGQAAQRRIKIRSGRVRSAQARKPRRPPSALAKASKTALRSGVGAIAANSVPGGASISCAASVRRWWSPASRDRAASLAGRSGVGGLAVSSGASGERPTSSRGSLCLDYKSEGTWVRRVTIFPLVSVQVRFLCSLCVWTKIRDGPLPLPRGHSRSPGAPIVWGARSPGRRQGSATATRRFSEEPPRPGDEGRHRIGRRQGPVLGGGPGLIFVCLAPAVQRNPDVSSSPPARPSGSWRGRRLAAWSRRTLVAGAAHGSRVEGTAAVRVRVWRHALGSPQAGHEA